MKRFIAITLLLIPFYLTSGRVDLYFEPDMSKVTEHLEMWEVVKSPTAMRYGIDNTPNVEQMKNIKLLAEKVFEPLRVHFDTAIGSTSIFRSEKLNSRIGGAKNSQHLANDGAAMDLDADIYDVITNKDIYEYIRDNLEFDQLIWEYGTSKEPAWVHVSYREGNNRKQLLRIYRRYGRKRVIKWH